MNKKKSAQPYFQDSCSLIQSLQGLNFCFVLMWLILSWMMEWKICGMTFTCHFDGVLNNELFMKILHVKEMLENIIDV